MDTIPSQVVADKDPPGNPFHWCGRIRSQSSLLWHHAILTIIDGNLHICLSGAQQSFTASVELRFHINQQLLDSSVAHVNDKDKYIAIVKTSLKSSVNDNQYVRIKELDDTQKVLYISTKWGIEYCQFSTTLDILAIPLTPTSDKSTFLKTLFTKLRTIQDQVNVTKQENANIDVEIEDIREAQERLNHQRPHSQDRLQVFLEALNDCKQGHP